MSIYSGFATRQLQQQYDSYTHSLISNTQKRLLKFYRGQPSDDTQFFTVIRKLFHAMRKMQKYKYLEPKLSESFRQLLEYAHPERLNTKDPTQLMNRITEERSQRDLIMQSPQLHDNPASKSKQIIEQYQKQMKFNPYQWTVDRPMTTRPSGQLIATIPEQKHHVKQRSTTNNKHRNETPQSRLELQKLLERQHPLKYYRASRNIKIGSTGKKNRTLDLPP